MSSRRPQLSAFELAHASGDDLREGLRAVFSASMFDAAELVRELSVAAMRFGVSLAVPVWRMRGLRVEVVVRGRGAPAGVRLLHRFLEDWAAAGVAVTQVTTTLCLKPSARRPPSAAAFAGVLHGPSRFEE